MINQLIITYHHQLHQRQVNLPKVQHQLLEKIEGRIKFSFQRTFFENWKNILPPNAIPPIPPDFLGGRPC